MWHWQAKFATAGQPCVSASWRLCVEFAPWLFPLESLWAKTVRALNLAVMATADQSIVAPQAAAGMSPVARWWYWCQTTLGLALLGSLLMWAALPPLELGWLAWIAPVPWLLLARRKQLIGRRPYRAIWLAGFVFWFAASALAPLAASGHEHWLGRPVVLSGFLRAAFSRPDADSGASAAYVADRGRGTRGLDRAGVGQGPFDERLHDGEPRAHAISLAHRDPNRRSGRGLRRLACDRASGGVSGSHVADGWPPLGVLAAGCRWPRRWRR